MPPQPLHVSDPTALDRGRAYAELDGFRLVLVVGGAARDWLHDLVTTDLASLGELEARRSLLLTPTGMIRATFHVIGMEAGDVLLAQPPGQPEAIDELLSPYVLSSDVRLASPRLRLVAIPGRPEPPAWAERASGPSALGGGADLLVDDDEASLRDVRGRLARDGLEPADAHAVESRRIRRGEPRFPIDLDANSLPAEAGWDAAPVTDRSKGCFLGQESVAKVANLGHPPRVVLPVEADGPLEPGTVVDGAGREAGALTSAMGSTGIARVRWDAREGPLATTEGTSLRPR
ncbi:MAG TPA: hypothetical protein VF129_05205 [Actinomycetota bacterium]